MKALITATLVGIASLGAVSVQAAGDHAGHDMEMQATTATETQLVNGQVRKVDKAAGKVTLAHGPLANLNMPAMTMVFRVKDAAWLDRMKVGDKIRFMAEQVNGVITVVHFEPAK
ncbi:MAG: RND transporter [Betaproteobacteria bacterium HGW-Betaproteobacteria-12]|jgi:Cu(I)/Ag(I) efflux system protein CusF|nr:MAG: RND transporter [Betaproteobacteria bacterium HGW-Betaproteobacteria-12]